MTERYLVGRHGDYGTVGDSERLTEFGRGTILAVVPQLAEFLGALASRGNTLVISSEAPRAVETAEIIAYELGGLTNIRKIALGDKRGKAFLGNWIVSQLDHLLGYPGMIIVTHKEQTGYLLNDLVRRKVTAGELPGGWFYAHDTNSGDTFMLDGEKKTLLTKPRG